MLPPNVVLVLADDLGYSDLGCYGGEIGTPNLDLLGRGGVRLSDFYNTARCSPSRASLLTGLHPHQTGVGILTNDDSPEGYPGSLNDRCVTIAEVLRNAGYRTGMVGKWHLSADTSVPNDSWPTRRGFEHFFGTLSGCGSYYQPATLKRGEADASAEFGEADFYYTDAISEEASSFIEACDSDSPTVPFFLYVAYTAPHWPLHAPESDIQRYVGAYDSGWDELREKRLASLKREGILGRDSQLSPRDPSQPPWEAAEAKDWEARRMSVYAAQVERMDRGIGTIIETLRKTNRLDNTVFVFLSDNGASAEELLRDVGGDDFMKRSEYAPTSTREGKDIWFGNKVEIWPGAENTYASYGRAWANLSNTPFRLYKRWVHEGGIAAPFIVNWPNGGLSDGSVVRNAFQLVDVMPTLLEMAGVEEFSAGSDGSALPLEGRSMLNALRGQVVDDVPLFWEHVGNGALRLGNWKIVREYPAAWELYDILSDRAESCDLAAENSWIVEELAQMWEKWSSRVGVIRWEQVLAIYSSRSAGMDPADG
ncbi:arylsulfatase [Amycolatopsis sp. K13G38]|uniref:Arylsulfatase n=1 Tax=Amycolatopsis acididurans TaxID=2724524 RepID=A0ABX1J5E9_9PSEU|nr:arylsulfatase [Amycolatopsis acididurans]NKQ55017.1 arylsulfatase [Amycolatopsis acididurans]